MGVKKLGALVPNGLATPLHTVPIDTLQFGESLLKSPKLESNTCLGSRGKSHCMFSKRGKPELFDQMSFEVLEDNFGDEATDK